MATGGDIGTLLAIVDPVGPEIRNSLGRKVGAYIQIAAILDQSVIPMHST